MFAHRAGYLSLVLGLLLPLILITNGDIEVGIPEYEVNPSNVSSSILDHEMEPRSDDSSVVNRSVERKSGGPFSYRRDSYLEALRHSRTSTDPREGIVDAVATGSFHRRKEQSFGPVYTTKRSEITPPSSSRVVHADSFSMVERPSILTALKILTVPPLRTGHPLTIILTGSTEVVISHSKVRREVYIGYYERNI